MCLVAVQLSIETVCLSTSFVAVHESYAQVTNDILHFTFGGDGTGDPRLRRLEDVCLKHANSSHTTLCGRVYTTVEKPRESRAREPFEPGRESVRDAVGVVGTWLSRMLKFQFS